MKKTVLLSLIFFLFGASIIFSQNPAKASIVLSKATALDSGDVVTLNIKLEPNKGWHVYSAIPSEEGVYKAASIEYDINSVGFEAKEMLSETGSMFTEFDDIMDGMMRYYKTPVTFSQELKITESPAVIKGTFDYMACDEERCLMFTEEFEIKQ